MRLDEKVNFLLKYCGKYEGHLCMIDEQQDNMSFHIKLDVEDEILDSLDRYRVFLLTGEAGDGKSRLIRKLNKQFIEKGFTIKRDFTELSKKEKESILDDIFLKEKKIVIAANAGVFLQSLIEYKHNTLDEFLNDEEIKRINFQKRNIASNMEIFKKIIIDFIDYDENCNLKSCKLNNECPFKNNIEFLKKDVVIGNLRKLCHAIYITGEHITFRELLSLISYMITNGLSCDNVRKDISPLNIFEDNQDILLKKFFDFDPAYKSVEDDAKLYYEKSKDINTFRNEKRNNFFMQEDVESINLLPNKYLKEYSKILDYLDKEETPVHEFYDNSNDLFNFLKTGLIKLISPNEDTETISYYDFPLSKDQGIKTKYKIPIKEITLFWCNSDYDNYKENIINKKEARNSFCLSFINNEKDTKQQNLFITYELFVLIMDAYYSIYRGNKNIIYDEYGISSFLKKIIYNLTASESDPFRNITVLFDDNNEIDFELEKITYKSKLRNKKEEEFIIIKKINQQ